MPPPDLPEADRPWRQECNLREEEFKAECRGWDVNEAVFTAAMWPMYHPLLRADFRIFDQYRLIGDTQYKQDRQDALGRQYSHEDQDRTDPHKKQDKRYQHESLDSEDNQGKGNGSASGVCPFTVPIHSFWGTQDRRITRDMVQQWNRFTTGCFTCSPVDGTHLWPLHKEPKTAWLQQIVNHLGQLRHTT